MAGGDEADGSIWVDEGHGHGDESGSLEVFDDEIVEAFDEGVRAFAGRSGGAGVGAADGHDEGGADAVAGDIGDGDDELAIGEGLPIVIITASKFGGTGHAGHFESGDWGRADWEESDLDIAGDAEVLLDGGDVLLGEVKRGGFIDRFDDIFPPPCWIRRAAAAPVIARRTL